MTDSSYADIVTDLDQPDELRTKVYGERTVYDNQWVRVTLVDIEPPDGHRFEHHVVRLNTVVATAVIDDHDRVLMMWRHRFATDQWGWELPGGILEVGEDPAACATREVLEETGWRPDSVEHVISFQPMPGIVDTPHSIYLARSASKVGDPTDLEEAAKIRWVPLARIPELAARNELLGSGTLVGMLFLIASGKASSRR